jgi:Notch-like protein
MILSIVHGEQTGVTNILEYYYIMPFNIYILITDPCESSPCKNEGKCYPENGELKCNCTSQFFGSNCEYERNPCQFIRCLNGGTCIPTSEFTNYTCLCLQGFQGLLCQEKADRRGG